jgi:hypothetical protein
LGTESAVGGGLHELTILSDCEPGFKRVTDKGRESGIPRQDAIDDRRRAACHRVVQIDPFVFQSFSHRRLLSLLFFRRLLVGLALNAQL